MADGHGHKSGEASAGDNARKRKIISTSDTGTSDGSFSPPRRKYKLRTTTLPGCVFAGRTFSTSDESRSTSCCSNIGGSSRVRGPSTCHWGPVQTNRLNFRKPQKHQFLFNNSREDNIIRFLLGPLTSSDCTVMSGPDIATTDIAKELLETCTGDPIKTYISQVMEGLRESGIDLLHPNEQRFALKAYLRAMMTEVLKTKKDISETVLEDLYSCIDDTHSVCSLVNFTEVILDELMVKMMLFIQLNEKKPRWYKRREGLATEIKFDICGSRVTSITNILWEFCPSLREEQFPILMVENKGIVKTGAKTSKQTGQPILKTRIAYHKKISQIIGQCMSIADKSGFETKDYKIVYHVSLMGTSKLVITRTHVAKSTLKVIKDGCPIPDHNDLDPSYVFEACFLLGQNVEETFFSLYTTLSIFAKLAYMSFGQQPIVESEGTSLRSVREKIKSALASKPPNKLASK